LKAGIRRVDPRANAFSALDLDDIPGYRPRAVHFLPWGFEGTGYVAFLSMLFASLFALSTLVIAAAHARSSAKGSFFKVTLLSTLSLLALIVLLLAYLVMARLTSVEM
jgi:hypothetical protein